MSNPPSPTQSLSFLQRRFREAGIHPKSRHGQNFLIDLNLLRLLVESSRVGSDDVVLEVGTGTGALTAQLAEQAAAVITVEIDPDMQQLAREQLARFQNITLLSEDVLATKSKLNPTVIDAVRKQLTAAPGRQFKLIANLPYNVATPLITNLLDAEPIPRSMTVTIQKEVADRLRARPRTKDYGALSVWVQSQCRVKVVRSLPPSAFWPKPKVMSAIVQLWFRPAWRERISDPPFFHDFVRAVFLHRRKYLRGVLVASFKDRLSKSDVDEILTQMQFGPTVRAEQLEVEQFLALSELVRTRLANSPDRVDD
jgi:16S rRNA (adenine1518-N6/adenine1519-N6)-dimethyltransferase